MQEHVRWTWCTQCLWCISSTNVTPSRVTLLCSCNLWGVSQLQSVHDTTSPEVPACHCTSLFCQTAHMPSQKLLS